MPLRPTLITTLRSLASALGIGLMVLGAVAACSRSSEPAASSEETSDVTGELTADDPVIACDEPTFEFGTISPSGSVEHVFTLVNRGTADLHIERVERT